MTLIIDGVDGIRALKNQDLGKSEWILITQEMVDQFAELTDDKNWVHVDPEKAKGTPFGGTIVHGFFTMSLLVKMKRSIMELRNIGMGLNYGFDKTRMPSVVPVGSRIRCAMEMGDVQDIGEGVHYVLKCTIECDKTDKPALVTDWVLRHYPGPNSRVK